MSRSNPQQFKEEPIRDKTWVFPFGKYRGFSLDDVIYADPLYVLWAARNTTLDFHSSIIDEIEEGGPYASKA